VAEFESHLGNEDLVCGVTFNEEVKVVTLDELTMANYSYTNVGISNHAFRENAVHKNVICNKCKCSPIVGNRYRCRECYNFDYCEICMRVYQDSHLHEFDKYVSVYASPILFNCRKSGVCCIIF